MKYRLHLSLFVGLGILTGISYLHAPKATALSGNEFKAGRIIDDNVFFNGSDMDIPTIQALLKSKLPACDTNGIKTIYDPNQGDTVSRAVYSQRRGISTPFTCLKDYMTDVYGMPADTYCAGSVGYGSFSAAGIIWSVSKACNINPKVLIVLLQKEQNLVTDDWPWPVQYASATGYGCPDTASCDGSYAGLFNQVYYAARQYQKYAKRPELFNFQRNVLRNISYQANSSTCGSSPVYLENQSTSGLYNYTPYQPNAAALKNLYGTGDGCSAYGNRNFWRMYNDWFGNTYGIPYSANFRGESSESVTLDQSKKPVVWFDFENTGANFWKDEASQLPYYPVTRLMGSWPVNRSSIFADSSWRAPSRPVGVFAKVFENDGVTLTTDQHTVFPGQVARFQFVINNPTGLNAGSYKENFELVQDGAPNFWVPGGYAWQGVKVPEPFSAQFKGESAVTTAVTPTTKGTVWFDFQNTGFQFWKDDVTALPYYPRTRLMGSWPVNRTSQFADPSWLYPNRPVSVFTKVFESDGVTLATDQHTVWPGQIARFQFLVAYPTTAIPNGLYKEDFELVQDGISNFWVAGGYAWQGVQITN
ncbi:hypothetical protein BH10PAT3_BH10PAT3_4010 [soil metagenome]